MPYVSVGDFPDEVTIGMNVFWFTDSKFRNAGIISEIRDDDMFVVVWRGMSPVWSEVVEASELVFYRP